MGSCNCSEQISTTTEAFPVIYQEKPSTIRECYESKEIIL